MEDNNFYQKKSDEPIYKLENNKSYQDYSSKIINEVPEDNLKSILTTVLKRAGQNMGSEISDSAILLIYDFLKTKFRFLPVQMMCSYILRGSLGEFGPGRLVPRTVYNWLLEANNDWQKIESKPRQETYANCANLNNYPLGRAIIKKIEWYQKGLLPINDWDKIPLKELAERIARGEDIRITDYLT